MWVSVGTKGPFPALLSALIGIELLGNLVLDPTIALVSNGLLFPIPAGAVAFPIAVLIIYSIVAMRAEFMRLRSKGVNQDAN